MRNPPEFRVEPLVNPVKMPDRVTAALLQLIRNGDYPAKSRLPSEMEMARRFGVSRTVIREAVSRLKSEGLVESRQGSGLYVREIGLDTPFRIDPGVTGSIDSVMQIVELRRGLESEIAALAAERCDSRQLADIRAALQTIAADVAAGRDGVDADMEFHRSIARATNNPHFLSLWDFLGQFLRGAMCVTRALESRTAEMAQQVLDEHHALVDAIARKNPEAARNAARRHMEMASRRLTTSGPVRPNPESLPAPAK
ncbi:MAG: GntR family transcriptional regulator [Herminiimonas sp.]|nr:GntR family transcriptional regulator [Herminiimonas sp.]